MEWTTIPHFVQYTAPLLGAVHPPTWGELGVYFAAALALIGAGYTATVTRRNGREANAVTAAQAAWKRLDDLEGDIKDLKDAQKETASIISAFTVFTEQLFRWGRGGGGEPEPTIPDKLRERLEHLIHDHEES
ncbi:hypothetical protein ACFYE2_00415 [Kocuria sp. CPCC 205300]|uniref:hypothetical protein n=1 Tax=Kocuria sabuli TaxID=3071448 RepID=UPI0036D9BCB7